MESFAECGAFTLQDFFILKSDAWLSVLLLVLKGIDLGEPIMLFAAMVTNAFPRLQCQRASRGRERTGSWFPNV